jgi:hypothetical protein
MGVKFIIFIVVVEEVLLINIFLIGKILLYNERIELRNFTWVLK